MRTFADFFYRDTSKRPASDKLGNLYVYKSQEAISVILVTTFGVNRDLLEDVILTTTKRLIRKADKLVYLTDSADFTIFRRHGVIFEYLPPLREQRRHAADMPWQSYLQQRWELLLAKWRPLHVISYGTRIDSFLADAPTQTLAAPSDKPKS